MGTRMMTGYAAARLSVEMAGRGVQPAKFLLNRTSRCSRRVVPYRALGIPPGNSKQGMAKYLILRFGLHPLLYRPVTAISTEKWKVLLARALATRPSLLVLDNAFDGLDVPSRVAPGAISLTLRGFSQLLVQGVDASATAHTQVLLITHRPEEIVNEISTVAVLSPDAEGGALSTHARDGRTAESLMQLAMGEGTDRRGIPW